ncbi:protein of unknown function [Enterobacter cancerogenus]|nr:protein of unknown function [Enterobacter cancerogenus]
MISPEIIDDGHNIVQHRLRDIFGFYTDIGIKWWLLLILNENKCNGMLLEEL